jgi:arsenical pump membrane protein
MFDMWRPFVTIVAMMITTGVAQHVGIFDYLSGCLEHRVRRRVESGEAPVGVGRLFTAVFVMSALTAAVLNNDAAILLLTPLIVDLARRLYPRRPDVVTAFAFAVFAAAGVAPLMISNPMNLIMATHSNIGFNEYAVHMIPISVLGWMLTMPAMRVVFRRDLAGAQLSVAGSSQATASPRLSNDGRAVFLLLLATLGAYPVVASLGGAVWPVAAASAVAAVAIAVFLRGMRLRDVAGTASWEILLFLYCVLVIVFGLQNVGLVDRIAQLYQGAHDTIAHQIAVVGATSAVGSAFLNNHPMAMLNQLAIQTLPGNARHFVFAALIGGDLGPRLLPMGSLAGLLWIELLRRKGITIRLQQFIAVGIAVTVPVWVLSLAMLYMEMKLGM